MVARLQEGQHIAHLGAAGPAGLKDASPPSREAGRKLLLHLYLDASNLLGLWATYEPNACDGQDAKNLTGSPKVDVKHGRFNPIWGLWAAVAPPSPRN